MTPIEAMESASLVAIFAMAVVPAVAKFFQMKNFTYPGLIAFCVGYVIGAGSAAALQTDGIVEDLIRIGAALASMQLIRFFRDKARAAA